MASQTAIIELIGLLELGDASLAKQRDILLEWQSHHPEAETSGFLQHLSAQLGTYPSTVLLHPRETLQTSKDQALFYEIASQTWVLVKTDARGKQWLYHGEGAELKRLPLRISTLQQLIGKKPVCWLKWTKINEVDLNAKKTTPRQQLRQFLKPETRELWLILGYAIAMGIMSLGIPIASQSLVNTVALGTLRQPLIALCVVLLIALGFLALLRSLQLILVEMLQRRIFVRLSQISMERLLKLEGIYRQKRRIPEVVNRFLDVVNIQKSLSFLLLDGLALLLQALTGLLLLAFYHPFLLVFDVLLLFCMLFILFALGIGGESSSIKESYHKYAMVAWLEELAAHPSLFRSHSGIQFASWKTENQLHAYLKAREAHFRVLLRQNVGAHTLQATAFTALLALGGWLVIEGQLTIGQLVAAELIVANILANFSKVGKQLEAWYDMMSGFDKVSYLLDLPQEKTQVSILRHQAVPMTFVFENVSCSQNGYTDKVQVNLVGRPGQTLALMGVNTWQSETLLDLLYGLRTPQQGLILVDDQPLHQLNSIAYRNQVAFVGQLELIEGSILDNLRLGHKDLSRNAAQELLQQVGLWQEVQHFPDTLDTKLSYNGFPFSPSDAHRLMIARALSMKPRLMMIDGTLDQIDWHAQDPIVKLLFQTPGFTLLVVTNQEPLLDYFDRVLGFDANGQLQEYPRQRNSN